MQFGINSVLPSDLKRNLPYTHWHGRILLFLSPLHSLSWDPSVYSKTNSENRIWPLLCCLNHWIFSFPCPHNSIFKEGRVLWLRISGKLRNSTGKGKIRCLPLEILFFLAASHGNAKSMGKVWNAESWRWEKQLRDNFRCRWMSQEQQSGIILCLWKEGFIQHFEPFAQAKRRLWCRSWRFFHQGGKVLWFERISRHFTFYFYSFQFSCLSKKANIEACVCGKIIILFTCQFRRGFGNFLKE